MTIIWFFLYVITGMGCAYWIFRDGEFRPIDSAVWIISAILFWPVVVPAWVVLRPPSQIKDLTWEKSYAHYKHWQKTHKARDIGDIVNLDKRLNKDNGSHKTDESSDFMGATSADHPYVIGSAGRTNSEELFPEKTTEDEYGWEEVDDRAPTYEIGKSHPRQAYNPFLKRSEKVTQEKPQPTPQSDEEQDESKYSKDKTLRYQQSKQSSFNVPSISDILEEHPTQAPKDSTKVFRDSNVRKLIDEGRLRDAYRVSRRMLKVAQELGEDDRAAAYRRYIREIENRMKAKQESVE